MIYFIRAGSAIKIGFTAKPLENRLRSIQTGCAYKLEVLGVMDGTIETENRLHYIFSKHRVNGEWFVLCDDIVTFIEQSCRPYLKSLKQAEPHYQRKDFAVFGNERTHLLVIMIVSVAFFMLPFNAMIMFGIDIFWLWVVSSPLIALYIISLVFLEMFILPIVRTHLSRVRYGMMKRAFRKNAPKLIS